MEMLARLLWSCACPKPGYLELPPSTSSVRTTAIITYTFFFLGGGPYYNYGIMYNYLYYFGGSFTEIEYSIPQNPILIIKAPTSLP